MKSRYVTLAVFSMMILGCNIIPMNTTPQNNLEGNKVFSTQGNNPLLKNIPTFNYNYSGVYRDNYEPKYQASLTASMKESDFVEIEKRFSYNSEKDGSFHGNISVGYGIYKREVKLGGNFSVLFVEKPKSYAPKIRSKTKFIKI